ncbi:MAG: hypothetical protein ACI8QZ_003413 [Chlamydiales bacterium]
MELSDRECYRALKAQDRRFDGRFYVCVTSTGIYCRPVCPARTSKFANCRFVKTAADLGLLKTLGARKASQLEAQAEAWRPWRGYAALHLWNSLSN